MVESPTVGAQHTHTRRRLVDARDLRVAFENAGGGRVHAVNGIDLMLEEGEAVALVGESGSGKSVTCRALLGLLPPAATIAAHTLEIGGVDVMPSIPDRGDPFVRVRGQVLSLIGQDPFAALNPHDRVLDQIVRVYANRGAGDARARAIELLELVGIARERGSGYPHEFSGGMCQRVCIALAVASDAHGLLADEPTSNLDVSTQKRILDLLERLRAEQNLGLLLVTHDIDLARSVCDRVLVMYGGVIVEEGPTREILRSARHPYSVGLLASVPTIEDRRRLSGIEGTAPVFDRQPQACPFFARCDRADEACAAGVPEFRAADVGRTTPCEETGEGSVDGLHRHRCVRPLSIDALRRAVAAVPLENRGLTRDLAPLLEVHSLSVRYEIRRGVLFGRTAGTVDALVDCSFSVCPGEVLGIIGETGAGKSTLIRALLRLVPATDGSIVYDGQEVTSLTQEEFRPFRDRLQVVFQNPGGSLDPTYAAGQAAAEPLAHQGLASASERWARAEKALAQCGLSIGTAPRSTTELSGGQKQRVSIARAVTVAPRLLIADEPVSALDASVKAGVLALLRDLVGEFGFAMIFVSHDLAVIRQVSDRVLLLRQGRTVEQADVAAFFAGSGSEYGRSLVDVARATACRGRR